MSTSSTYEITGRFDATQIIARFKQIEKVIRQNEKALKDLQRASNDLLKANREMGRAADQTQRAHDRAHARRVKQIREQESALAKAAKSYDRLHGAGGAAKAIFRDSFQGVLDWRHDAKSLARAEAQFKVLNLGAEETKKGLDAVSSTVDKIGGVRLDTLTGDLIGLKSVFGDLRGAIDFLPTAAKTRFTFQALYNADPEQLERDITDTMKALEQIGGIRQLPGGGVDVKRLQQYYDTVMRIRAMTGGRIGGSELRQFVQTSGVAGMALEPEGLMNLVSVMEAMGGGQTGTALMSAFMQFRAFRQGAGGARAAAAMQQLGLLKSEGDLRKQGLAEFTREGRIKKLMPGAMPVSDLLGKDPLMFADALAEAIKTHGHRLLPKGKKADLQDADQVATILTQITGSRTAANVLAKMIVLRENIRKDAENLRKAMGGEDMFKLADESDVGKILKFEAALTNFKARAGIPLIGVLSNLATAGKPFLDFLSHHPSLTLWAVGLLKLASSLARVYAMFRMFKMSRAITDSLNPAGVTPMMGKTGAGWGSTLATTLKTTVAAAGIGYYIAGLLKDAGTKEAMREAAAELAGAAREGVETDLTQLDAAGRSEAVRAEQMRKAQEQAQRRVASLGLSQATNEQNFIEGLLGLDQPSGFVQLLYGLKHGKSWTDLEFGPFSQNVDRDAFRNRAMGMLTATPFKTDAEVGKFLEAARLTLEKAGAGDLFPVLKQLTQEAAPELLRSYEEHQKKQKELADQTGLTGDRVRLLGEAAGNAATSLQNAAERLSSIGAGTSHVDPDSAEGLPIPGHAAGGRTRKGHRAWVGEKESEFIIPESRAKDYFAAAAGASAVGGITGPLFHIPVSVAGDAYPGIEDRIAGAIERKLGPMLFNSGILEKILTIKMKDITPGA
jgi:hypothetical protein